MVWGPACYALKDRDQWLGWCATHRGEQLKLIVQNRRFLVLADPGQAPWTTAELQFVERERRRLPEASR